jgi:hypothetical protein
MKKRRKKKKHQVDKLIPLATAIVSFMTAIINLIIVLTR